MTEAAYHLKGEIVKAESGLEEFEEVYELYLNIKCGATVLMGMVYSSLPDHITKSTLPTLIGMEVTFTCDYKYPEKNRMISNPDRSVVIHRRRGWIICGMITAKFPHHYILDCGPNLKLYIQEDLEVDRYYQFNQGWMEFHDVRGLSG